MVRKNQLPQFPKDYLNEKAEEYDSSKWMERNQKRSTLLSIQYLFDEKLVNQNERSLRYEKKFLILDLGCGTGFSSEILVENGFRVIGVDILPDMILRARDKKEELVKPKFFELILADINYLPIRSNEIDHIISISAYNFIAYGRENYGEKIKQLTKTAKYIDTILKKNGRIVIEFYPKDDKELNIFKNSFINNGFDGFMVKNNPKQKAGQTFLLLKKRI
ncbi:MAG: class I SAM-dependent methyltransferase [Candidatus Lokiarchaeota archaeon]|nr:class I SAM-dependent methyltransferase [Candidatus Lokiarchaeota archaeon]